MYVHHVVFPALVVNFNIGILLQPSKKGAGETHIRNMNRDLKLYVIQELSAEKTSGNMIDWTRLYSDEILIYVHLKWSECVIIKIVKEWLFGHTDFNALQYLHGMKK